MDDVKRYGHISYLVEATPAMVELYPSMTIYTLASDFVAQRLRADTAEAELQALRNSHEVGLNQRAELIGSFTLRLEKNSKKLKALVDRNTRLKYRISAAEQRIADRDALIADVLKAFMLDEEGRGSCRNPGYSFIRPWTDRVAALSTASSCSHAGAVTSQGNCMACGSTTSPATINQQGGGE